MLLNAAQRVKLGNFAKFLENFAPTALRERESNMKTYKKSHTQTAQIPPRNRRLYHAARR